MGTGQQVDQGDEPALGCEPSDEQLVADLRRRRPGALGRLHRRYALGVYNLALRTVHHHQDAEDITHDVLIRAFERLPRDRELNLRPWLYRVTLNRCYDHLRAAARRRPVDPESHDAPSLHDPFEQAELGALFERALDSLTARQQAALLLKDVHGLSTSEVAFTLDLTTGSAEVLLARARGSFRTRFAAIAGLEPEALPRSLGAALALPLAPLPPGLLAPPVLPPTTPLPLPDVSAAGAGAGLAGSAGLSGGGFGTAVANSAALKLAAVLAAAASLTAGTAGTSARHHPPHRVALSARAAVTTAATTTARIGAPAITTTRRAAPQAGSTAPARALAPTPASSPSAAIPPSPLPTPSATEPADTGSRPGEIQPTPTATPSTPAPISSPTPSTSPSPSDTPTPSSSPTPSDSPTPTP